MSDLGRVKELLRGRVEELAAYLFPDGRREGAHWCIGDITGSPGKSFKICLSGEKAGVWGDFADSQKHSRSLLDLWKAMEQDAFDSRGVDREAEEARQRALLERLNGTEDNTSGD